MVLPDQLDIHDLKEILVRLGIRVILVQTALIEQQEKRDILDIQDILAQAQQYNDQLDTLGILDHREHLVLLDQLDTLDIQVILDQREQATLFDQPHR